ncbi:ribosome small subunit-dependent GTPase A [Flagellimonas flava]|uniref:Small ribosomal subunit biogenesis GTPase RsgA n=1 Tax=Flagellimonas flava TaxID=570519 RepID=A0A1M5IJ35_9FLAO|nr:ribosome small subunit-dependent GTPase A [Allomuricauda flava]SHG28384.1 ribosome biogenesis GTPase [Allomuricauda flava]
MKLKDLGYNNEIEKLNLATGQEDLVVGRVITEHKERYIVQTELGEFEAEITGNLRYTATSRASFPAVGDWVTLMVYDAHSAIIHKILPRFSTLSRKAVGRLGDIQIIAANINYALIVQAVDRDFNLNRLERYITLCHNSQIEPIIVLNKIDLVNEVQLSAMMGHIQNRMPAVQLLSVSAQTQLGLEELKSLIEPGKTYCLLGSSGVGKSSLVNVLSKKQKMESKAISEQSNRGQHTTTHRELLLLDGGGILIDNPGMREVGITDTAQGLEKTFDTLLNFSENCKFKDCTHTVELGCAIIEAVESGTVDKSLYENYLKMEKEKAHFESSIAEKRKKDKDFGKMVKHFKNLKKSKR